MATLSDFGYERRSVSQRLLSKLICKVLGVQPGEDNHELALGFCLHSTNLHRFGDTNPKAVDEQYDSLQARMVVNAQFGKQKALQQLRTLFLQQPLNKETLEVHHRVLSALLSLSRQPLQYKYTAPPFLSEQSPNSLLTSAQGEDDAGSDVSELSAWDDETAAGRALGVDELSDWSEDDLDLIKAGVEQHAAAPTGAEPGSPAKPQKQLMSESWDFDAAAKIRIQPVRADENPAYEDGCLLRLLAATRAKGVPFVTPSSRLLFTEQDLVLQVLHMLRGSPSPGRAFTLNPNLDAYEVTAGAHVAHLSPGCLRNMLNRFSRSGTTSYRLQMFVEAVKSAAATPSQTRMPAGRAELAAAPTLAAFAAAAADELAAVQSALIGVQEDFAAHLREGGNAAADVGLIALEAAVQAPMRRLELLEAAVSAVEVGGPGRETAAGQAAALLDDLHALLRSLAHDATPQGRAEAAVVLRLLMRAARPLLDALQTWLDHGLVTDSEEFLICSAPELAVQEPSFWHSGAFWLRMGTDGVVICPNFLRPMAPDILTAGKSALLLRLPQQQPCRPAPHQEVDATPEVPGRASLYQDILLRLEHNVSVDEEEGDGAQSQPASMRESAFAERMAACSKCDLASPCTYLEVGAFAAESAVDAFSAAIKRAAPMHQPPGHANIIVGPLSLPAERGWGLACHLASDISADTSYASSPCTPPATSDCAGAKSSPRNTDSVGGPEFLADMPAHPSGPSSFGQGHTAESGGDRGEAQQKPMSSSGSRSSPGRFSASGASPGCDSALGDVSVLGDVSNLSLSARRAARSALPKGEGGNAIATALPTQPPIQAVALCTSAASAVNLATIDGVDQGLKDWYTRILHAMRNPTGLLDPNCCISTGTPSGTCTASQEWVPASVQATLIRPFSGKAVQQMWGDKWECCGVAHDKQVAWLAALQDLELPPLDVAMQECVLAPIQERVDRIGGKLLASLMGSQNLRQQLRALHNVYLLASPALQPFQENLFRLLAERGDKPLDATGPGVLFELQGSLEQCLADERGGPLLPAHALTLHIAADEGPAAAPKRGNTIAALQPLQLRSQQHWPLSLIVQDSHMEQYNDVLRFLLQVDWAKGALQGLQNVGIPGTRGVDATDALSWQMSHFVMQLHTFVMESLMHTALPQLSQALEAARTLDDVAAAHDAFLLAATRAAMVAKERTWVLVLQGVCRLLDLALTFADVAKDGAVGRQQVADISAHWRDKHRYLMRLLTARTLRSGVFASLERLAARLDFNGFYADTQ